MESINLDEVVLLPGSHKSREKGVCIMEMVAWLAGEPHTDAPECTPPTIAAFLRNWNDSLDDTTRQKLKPYAPRVIKLSKDLVIEEKRAWLATDWLARVCTPAFLEAAGLSPHADALKSLAPLQDAASAEAAQIMLNAARAAAGAAAGAAAWDAARAAAWDAAGAAAWAAAGAAARAAAGAAAGDAAWAAAWDAAWAAAWAAARAAARAAAGEKLNSTVLSLQISAFDLLDRMIAA